MLQFQIRVLLIKNTIGIAVDQIYEQQQCIHLTNYYFWPRNDAWELIRLEINSKAWISNTDKISILNQITKILNKWTKNNESSKSEVFDNEYDKFNYQFGLNLCADKELSFVGM